MDPISPISPIPWIDDSNLQADTSNVIKVPSEKAASKAPKMSLKAKEQEEAEALAEARLKAPRTNKLPNINGITFFLDPTKSEEDEGALTQEIRQALCQKVPIVANPHVIQKALSKLDPKVLKDFDIYHTKERFYFVLIPKFGEVSIPLRSLKLNPNLIPLNPDRIIGPDYSVFDPKMVTKYKDLLEVFQTQGTENFSKLQLAFYVIGHGSIATGTTANLPNAQYQDFIRFLNRQYSISACAVNSCEPHCIEPEIDGIFVRKGTPNINSTINDKTDFASFFNKINKIDPNILGIDRRKELSEALEHVFARKEYEKQPIVRLPAIRGIRIYPAKNRCIITMRDVVGQQLSKHTREIRERSKSEIPVQLARIEAEITKEPPSLKKLEKVKSHRTLLDKTFIPSKKAVITITEEMNELHLFPPYIPTHIEIIGKVPRIFSHQRQQGIHVFSSVAAKSVSLEQFVNSCFPQKGETIHIQTGNHIYLFKELALDGRIYKNLFITMTPESGARCTFLQENPLRPDEAPLVYPENIFKADTKTFLTLLSLIPHYIPNEKIFREITDGKMTIEELLELIRVQFFPESPWISDITSGDRLFAFLVNTILSKKPLDPSEVEAIVKHLHTYNFLEKEIRLFLEPDETKPVLENKGILTLKSPIGPVEIKPEDMKVLFKKGEMQKFLLLAGRDTGLKYTLHFNKKTGEFSLIFQAPFPHLINCLKPNFIPQWKSQTFEVFRSEIPKIWKAIREDIQSLKVFLAANPGASIDYFDPEIGSSFKPLDYAMREKVPSVELIQLLISHGATSFTGSAIDGHSSLATIIEDSEGMILPELNQALILLASINEGEKIDKEAWIAAAKKGADLKVLTPFIIGLKNKFIKRTLTKERMLAAIERPNADLLRMMIKSGVPIERSQAYLLECMEVESLEKFKLLIEAKAIDPIEAFKTCVSKGKCPEFIAYLISHYEVPKLTYADAEKLRILAVKNDSLSLYKALEARKAIFLDPIKLKEEISNALNSFNPNILNYLLSKWQQLKKGPSTSQAEKTFFENALRNPLAISLLLQSGLEYSADNMYFILKSIFSPQKRGVTDTQQLCLEIFAKEIKKGKIVLSEEQINDLFTTAKAQDSLELFSFLHKQYTPPLANDFNYGCEYFSEAALYCVKESKSKILEFLLEEWQKFIGAFSGDDQKIEKIIEINIQLFVKVLQHPDPFVIATLCKAGLITNPMITKQLQPLLYFKKLDEAQRYQVIKYILWSTPDEGKKFIQDKVYDPEFLQSILHANRGPYEEIGPLNRSLLINFLIRCRHSKIKIDDAIIAKINKFISDNKAHLMTYSGGRSFLEKWTELNLSHHLLDLTEGYKEAV